MKDHRRERISRLLHDHEYRHAFAESILDTSIAAQIKANREQRGWTQKELGERAPGKPIRQSTISEMEDVNYSKWSLSSLKRLAKAFDLRLVVRFESFGTLFEGIQVPGELSTVSQRTLARPSFRADVAFTQRRGSQESKWVTRPSATSSMIEPDRQLTGSFDEMLRTVVVTANSPATTMTNLPVAEMRDIRA